MTNQNAHALAKVTGNSGYPTFLVNNRCEIIFIMGPEITIFAALFTLSWQIIVTNAGVVNRSYRFLFRNPEFLH